MIDIVLKVAIITGGANGIGAATVRKFLDEGAMFVAFIDIDQAAGNLLERQLKLKYGSRKVKFFWGDVTDDADLSNVFYYTIRNYGHIDVVINNAGIFNDALYKREIDINYKAVVTGSLKALQMMRKDNGGKGGTVINISSLAGIALYDVPFTYVYAGTKSAVLLFSNYLGVEAYYKYTGVRVITMCFGVTSTKLLENMSGFDYITTKGTRQILNMTIPQSVETAAEGIVTAYRNGSTSSTWFVNEGKITDITQRVRKAYKIMAGEIE